jgi:predicted Zn-ribbon and HTH transcriptional regulator
MRAYIFGVLVAIGAVAGCGNAEQTKAPATITPAASAVADTNRAIADTTKTKAVYTCPMHPQVSLSAPGRCQICGMALKAKAVYTCPMHPQVRVSAPGRCPTCGMNLVKAARDTSAHSNCTH